MRSGYTRVGAWKCGELHHGDQSTQSGWEKDEGKNSDA